MYFTRFIYFPLCIWCCSVSYSEEALDSLRIREIKMSFLDVFPLCLFHPSTNVFSPKKEETGTEIKKRRVL